MFLVSYNSNGLTMDVFEAIKWVAESGYDGIELAFDDIYFHPLRVDKSFLDSIKECLHMHNIKLSALTDGCAGFIWDDSFEPSLISVTEHDRAQRIHVLTACIDIAQYLHCPVLNIVSGLKQPHIPQEESLARLHDSINNLLQICNTVTLALEPEPNMLIETTQQAITCINQLSHPRFKMNLDIGHVKCSESSYLEKIEQAAGYAVNCHIEDIKGTIHNHLIPGEGDIDFHGVMQALEHANYQGYLSVELYPQADIWKKALTESIAYLRNIKT